MKRSLLLATMTAALSSAPASAAPPPDAFAGMRGIVFRYYDISGTDQRTIYTDLQRRAMRRPDGSLAVGLTEWALDYRWDQLSDQYGCHSSNPRAKLNIIVTLPRLAGADRLPQRVRDWWTGYRRTIERHEAGHARIAIDHQLDFARAAEGSRCSDTRMIGERVINRVTALQEDYDRITAHGQQQGAVD